MRPQRQRGFNLLELMFAVTIAGIALGIGIPSLTQFVANNRVAGAANDLLTSIHVARTEAVKRRASVTLCASSDWQTADPDCDLAGGGPTGWIVFADDDGDVAVDEDEDVVLAHPPLQTPLTFAIDVDSSPYMQFAANGFPRAAAVGAPITNIVVCDARGDVAVGLAADDREIAAGRWLQLGATGRPQVYRLREDVQGSPLGGC